MGRYAILLGFVLCASVPVRAQDEAKPRPPAPKFELAGGYSYTALNYSATSTNTRLNGWHVSPDYNLNLKWVPWLSVAGSVSEVFGTESAPGSLINGTRVHLYTYALGPRVYPLGRHRWTPFGQVLFGYGRITESLAAHPPFPAVHAEDSSLGLVVEGGLDIRLTPRWALRAIEGGVQTTTFFSSATGSSIARLSAGIVYSFGRP